MSDNEVQRKIDYIKECFSTPQPSAIFSALWYVVCFPSVAVIQITSKTSVFDMAAIDHPIILKQSNNDAKILGNVNYLHRISPPL